SAGGVGVGSKSTKLLSRLTHRPVRTVPEAEVGRVVKTLARKDCSSISLRVRTTSAPASWIRGASARRSLTGSAATSWGEGYGGVAREGGGIAVNASPRFGQSLSKRKSSVFSAMTGSKFLLIEWISFLVSSLSALVALNIASGSFKCSGFSPPIR